jgi:hypothetical protein
LAAVVVVFGGGNETQAEAGGSLSQPKEQQQSRIGLEYLVVVLMRMTDGEETLLNHGLLQYEDIL